MRAETSELILLCARLNIDDATQQKIRSLLAKPLKWDEIINLSERHQALPFLYYNLNRLNFQDIVSQGAFTKMKSCYYMNINRNMLFEKEMSGIAGSAAHNGIDIIPIKGFPLTLDLYNNPGLRIMADIDILIKKDDLYKIKPVFIESGFREIMEEHQDCRHMAIFSKKLAHDLPLNIEIHSGLAYARPHEINIPQLLERAAKKIINNAIYLFLSPEDTFISLVLHLRSHTRRLALKFIVDIAELLNKDGDKFGWPYIKRLARDNHFMTSVYLFLYLAKELLEANIRVEIIDEFAPGVIKRILIRSIINKRNFLVLKKLHGAFLRFLIFDSIQDFLLYLWRVSFLERPIANKANITNGESIRQ